MPTRKKDPSITVRSIASTTLIHGTVITGGVTPPATLKPITENDLPPEAQKILGQICKTGDCLNEQPLCPPDPRITCQLIAADPSKKKWIRDWEKLPWRVENAQKGDLILTPGTSGGVIGGLLSKLRPPQHYTHMGIMIRDQDQVRHATVSDEWLQDHPNGNIILDGPRPTDGFEPDAVRYGWPGTITQSIETAYLASLDSHYAPASIKAEDNGKDYVIHALSFSPVPINLQPDDSSSPNWKTFYPLVVKPCPTLETWDIRKALHRIADAVIALRGHYRYYAYSKGDITEDPNYFSKGQKMWEQFMPDPTNKCKPLIKVENTIPVVCSTLIWAAVQRVNELSNVPRIVLDNRQFDQDRPVQNSACDREYQSADDYGSPDLKPGHNGLYKYTEAERIDAATKLYSFLKEKCSAEIADAVPGIVKGLGGGIITVGLFLSLMSLPIGAIVTLLGLSLAEVNKLVEWFSDLPEDVANQITNAFASDYCDTSAKDSDQWQTPGEGVSVSPDNIINYWSAPNPNIGDPREVLYGVYGYNKHAILRPPKWQIRPLQAWAVSAGPAEISGQVFFQGKPINHALIKVCCSKTYSKRYDMLKRQTMDGYFNMPVPAGDYLIKASYDDPDGALISAEQEVSIPFQGNPWTEIHLLPPPDSDREIVISGKMDLVKRVIVGHDHWSHPQFEMTHLHVGPYGRPGTPDENMGKVDETGTNQGIEGFGSARIKVKAEWQPDFSVNVSWVAALYEDDDEAVSTKIDNFNIPKDSNHGWIVDLVSGGAAPTRGHIEFTVSNNLQE